jgi:hypothetical protein
MPNSTEIPELLNSISEDIRLIIADEIALAKTEIKPVFGRIGRGTGLFGAAAYFAISATIVGWFTLAAGFSWLYSLTSLSPLGCLFFGTLTTVVVIVVITGVLILTGKRSFSGITGPQRTPETIDAAIDAIKSGVADGKARVALEMSTRDANVGASGEAV